MNIKWHQMNDSRKQKTVKSRATSYKVTNSKLSKDKSDKPLPIRLRLTENSNYIAFKGLGNDAIGVVIRTYNEQIFFRIIKSKEEVKLLPPSAVIMFPDHALSDVTKSVKNAKIADSMRKCKFKHSVDYKMNLESTNMYRISTRSYIK